MVQYTARYLDSIRTGNRNSVFGFLLNGADPNGRFPDGTPLITQSVKSGFVGTVIVLAEAGADLEATDSAGLTPMMWAFHRTKNVLLPPTRADLCWQLGRRGANLDIPLPKSIDPLGRTGWIRLQESSKSGMKSAFQSLTYLAWQNRIPQSDLGKLRQEVPKRTLAYWRERPTHFFNQTRSKYSITEVA